MGIIPKSGEQKEAIGVLSLLFVHYLLGVGIAIVGQRTKNVIEFWCGVLVFVIAVSLLLYFLVVAGSVEAFRASLSSVLYGLFSLMTWFYIIVRLIWIFIKKETKLTPF